MTADEEDREQPRSFPTLPKSRYSRALERGLAILACFTPEHRVLGISEIADELGISRATTHRYVVTLVTQGHLQRDESRKYRLAPGAIELGMATLNATGLCKHARPYLRDLAQRTGYVSEMAVLDGPAILVLDSVTARRRQSDSDVYDRPRLPIYCTSMGKMLLAYLPERPRLRLLAKLKLTARTANTITSRQTLVEQLEWIRSQGLAANDEELVDGSCAIAAPVRDDTGDVVAAVNLVASDGAIDIEELLELNADDVLGAAERLSMHLGWRAG